MKLPLSDLVQKGLPCGYLLAEEIPVSTHKICFGAKIKKSIYFSCKPAHDKTNKMTCAPSEDSDQPGPAQSDQSSLST